MALTFSIKQTGVPAGAALAGALLPAAGAGDRLAARVRRRRVARRRRARRRAADPRAALDADRDAATRGSRSRESSRRSRSAAAAPALLELSLSRLRLRGDAGLPDELSRRVPDRDAAAGRSSPPGFALTAPRSAASPVASAGARSRTGSLQPRRVLVLIGVVAGVAASRWRSRRRDWPRGWCLLARRCCSARRPSAGTASSCPRSRGSRRPERPARSPARRASSRSRAWSPDRRRSRVLPALTGSYRAGLRCVRASLSALCAGSLLLRPSASRDR